MQRVVVQRLHVQVLPSDSSKCGDSGRGGDTCKNDCCTNQWNHCTNSGITDVHTLFKCMNDRGCMDFATTKVNGDDGKQCDVGSLNFSIDPNWTDDKKCGGKYQGNASCNDQCCATNINHCRGRAPLTRTRTRALCGAPKPVNATRSCRAATTRSKSCRQTLPSAVIPAGGATRAKMIVAQSNGRTARTLGLQTFTHCSSA